MVTIAVALFASFSQRTGIAGSSKNDSGKGNRPVTLVTDAVDESAGGVPCFKVKTKAATYCLEKVGNLRVQKLARYLEVCAVS